MLSACIFAAHMAPLKAFLPTTQMIKFAIDVTLLCPYKSNDCLSVALTSEFENMKKRCYSCGLERNDNKTKITLFKKSMLSSQTIFFLPIPSEINILEIVFQENLNWDSYISTDYVSFEIPKENLHSLKAGLTRHLPLHDSLNTRVQLSSNDWNVEKEQLKVGKTEEQMPSDYLWSRLRI